MLVVLVVVRTACRGASGPRVLWCALALRGGHAGHRDERQAGQDGEYHGGYELTGLVLHVSIPLPDTLTGYLSAGVVTANSPKFGIFGNSF